MPAESSSPRRPRVTLGGLRSAFGNALLGLLFTLFFVAHFASFMQAMRLSLLLIVLKEGLDAFFYLTRRAPESFSRSPYEWSIALCGTFAPLLFRPVDAPDELLAGQILILAGLAFQLLGMCSLRRSIGMVPANRGIVTDGLYRYVRHPLYCAYTFTHVGYLLIHATPYNAGVFALWLGLQLLRIFNEERFLSRDSAYRDFLKTTRWRLLPLVF